jgi:hypothetical protein
MNQEVQDLKAEHSKEIAEIRHDINAMRQALNNTVILLNESNTKRDELETHVKRLVFLLEGDTIDKDRGFIARLIALEKFSLSVKDTKAYLLGNIAAAVFIITLIGSIIGAFIKVYFFFKGQ